MFVRLAVAVLLPVLLTGCKSDDSIEKSIDENHANQAPFESSQNTNGGPRDGGSGTQRTKGGKSSSKPKTDETPEAFATNCQGPLGSGYAPGHATAADSCYRVSSCDAAEPFTVTVYFVRHGESEWNAGSKKKSADDLNQEKAGIDDPIIRDAKLTSSGAREAESLHKTILRFGNTTDDWKILAGNYEGTKYKVAYATSNLRRASLTFLIAFKHLIKGGSKGWRLKLHILSALQEEAKNIDSNSLAAPKNPPALTLDGTCPIKRDQIDFDSQCNDGDEMLPGIVGRGDLLANFCTWMRNMAVFGKISTGGESGDTCSPSTPIINTFVVAGHSMFLRSLFQKYLKYGGFFVNRTTRKIASSIDQVGNGALVKFRVLLKGPKENGKDVPVEQRCRIIAEHTRLLEGEIHGRNVFKHTNLVLRASKTS